ncbi:MAG: ADP-heptose--lipooligosaccharide heptosyltransferase II [uncultured Rubrobacteraceae bacterium]|uniref:ADP-heptose--lipooligosaccharide heptosyltransferase II n=1 Tax=uncultured Rubrobacteraceae bacterium TaxID=349277 RepID=A0A6J4QWQ8_9ACTN|nr:MAG: ADP-heptose--lipooligosaccharide heptosyltransferase II [uncultured Rubrobacteraceae bacterium]
MSEDGPGVVPEDKSFGSNNSVRQSTGHREFRAKRDGKSTRIRRLLFVELLGGLGDVLISLQAIQALARSHPEARLTVLTFPPGGELLERDPLIHDVVQAPSPGPDHPHRAREAVEEMLVRGEWDLVVSDTSYDGINGLIRASGVPRVVSNLWQGPPPDERVGERFLRILLSEGLISPREISPPRLHLATEERSAAASKLPDQRARRPLAFLLPDAGMEVKRWPEENWGALGRALTDHYGANVIVPAGSDLEQASRVARLIGERARVWPRGTLRELAAALSHADLAVGADTGPARIAGTLGVPTVMLFGPSWHGRYGQPPPHANLQGHHGCPQRIVSDFTQQPCWYAGTCTLEDPPWRTCMEDISVEDALTAAAPFLEARGDPYDADRRAYLHGGTP